MSRPPRPALIIADGTPAALTACWAEAMVGPAGSHPAPPATVLWFPPERAAAIEPPARQSRRRAAAVQAELCAVGDVIDGPAGGDPGTSAMLLAAAAEAIGRGLSRIVWPAFAGRTPRVVPISDQADLATELDLDAATLIVDRAALTSHLASLDAPPDLVDGVRIETPYADFGERELVDLALDMDTPLWASWWCGLDGEAPCGACPSCRRFLTAVQQVAPGLSAGILRPRPDPGPAAEAPRPDPAAQASSVRVVVDGAGVSGLASGPRARGEGAGAGVGAATRRSKR